MRTFFDIVLGILTIVLKACVHTLVSSASVLAGCALLLSAGLYGWRRAAVAKAATSKAKVISIQR
jgi:hypothetical protein